MLQSLCVQSWACLYSIGTWKFWNGCNISTCDLGWDSWFWVAISWTSTSCQGNLSQGKSSFLGGLLKECESTFCRVECRSCMWLLSHLSHRLSHSDTWRVFRHLSWKRCIKKKKRVLSLLQVCPDSWATTSDKWALFIMVTRYYWEGGGWQQLRPTAGEFNRSSETCILVVSSV